MRPRRPPAAAPPWSSVYGIFCSQLQSQPHFGVQNLRDEEGQGLCCLPVCGTSRLALGVFADDVSERRRRCESRAPGLACRFCVARGLSCSSGGSGKGVHGHDVPFSNTFYPRQTDNRLLPTKSLCAELVQLYFDYVHDQFHTLFHPPSFEEDMNRGQVPPILLYGMMALSVR